MLHVRLIAGLLLLVLPMGVMPVEKVWPFYIPKGVQPPEVQSDWVRNDVDRFVLQKLTDHDLKPAEVATKRTLIRRLYFDLIGLPPTPEQINEFLNDDSEDAYPKLVDRLLDDSRYGERWARYWLDLARYADTAGYEGDPDLPHAWRYRDYVIDAFNSDKPYDRFIKEQIAGDEFSDVMGAGHLPATTAENTVAMTFLRLAPFTEPRGDETRHEMLSEITSTVGSVFLGLTVGCAKCHDHKHDDIPTEDFYRMKAFFATVQIPPPEAGDIYQIGGSLDAKFYREGEEDWAKKKREQLEKHLQDSKDELATLKEEVLKRKKTKDKDFEDRKVNDLFRDGSSDSTAQERERFAYLSTRDRFVKQDMKRLLPVAMSLRHSYGPPYEPGVPTSRVMIRGEYDNPGDIVEPGFLSVISGNQDPASIRLDPFKRWPTRSRRMALAKWIASEDNPMTARVIVNRLWHWHFGQGIVQTPSDFGQLSGGPSHKELLDWLAEKLVTDKWSLKAIHRVILNSATYRQSSAHTDEVAERTDPENRLLWRFNRRRLDAAAVRDSVLAVSGRLNTEQFGLPIFPPLPGDISELVKYDSSKWDTQSGTEGRKRSIYIYQQRTLTMPLMQTFDALVCEESRPRRRTSVTPLQALAMYNGDFVNEEAKHFAVRARDFENSISDAFEAALGRRPTESEVTKLRKLVDAAEEPGEGLERVCRVLFNTNEFLYID